MLKYYVSFNFPRYTHWKCRKLNRFFYIYFVFFLAEFNKFHIREIIEIHTNIVHYRILLDCNRFDHLQIFCIKKLNKMSGMQNKFEMKSKMYLQIEIISTCPASCQNTSLRASNNDAWSSVREWNSIRFDKTMNIELLWWCAFSLSVKRKKNVHTHVRTQKESELRALTPVTAYKISLIILLWRVLLLLF